jgi:hypothetical protein
MSSLYPFGNGSLQKRLGPATRERCEPWKRWQPPFSESLIRRKTALRTETSWLNRQRGANRGSPPLELKKAVNPARQSRNRKECNPLVSRGSGNSSQLASNFDYCSAKTQRGKRARTQRVGRWGGKNGVEPFTQWAKLLNIRNPCVLALLQRCHVMDFEQLTNIHRLIMFRGAAKAQSRWPNTAGTCRGIPPPRR